MTDKQKKLLALLPPPRKSNPDALTPDDFMEHYGLERSAATRKMEEAVNSGKAKWDWGTSKAGRLVRSVILK